MIGMSIINYNLVHADGSIQCCSNDTTQGFYIPIGKGKLNLHTGIRGGYYLPALELPEDIQLEPVVIPTFIYFKNDIRALELNSRVTELENANKYLLETIKEMRANASKRKGKRVKYE